MKKISVRSYVTANDSSRDMALIVPPLILLLIYIPFHEDLTILKFKISF